MKALFSRFNRAHSKDKVKDPRESDSLSPPASSYQKEKPPQLYPLREWPPPPLELPQRSIGTPTSITAFKPLPELSFLPLSLIEDSLVHFTDYDPISISHFRGPLSDVAEEDPVDTAVGTRTTSPRADQDSAGRNSRKTGNGIITTTNGRNDVPKKAAFLSLPPIPSGLSADRPLPEDESASNTGTAVRSQPSHLKNPRGSISTTASGSRPNVGSSKNNTQTVTSTRSVTSPYPVKPAYGNDASIHQSLRSAIPFSQMSIRSVLPPASSSEGTKVDLITHLGPRERTRQEVLSEIVAGEERYVAELLKMKDTFIVPLLHPCLTSPVTSPHQLPDDLRQCLEVIEESILPGHLRLSEGLRKRYDEQYPIVRSLADVFVANSQILRGYADYVLHLERALEQANDVISTINSTKPPNKDADEWLKSRTFLRKLENDAQDRGETGLSISLSKPFQRLLKYPLLFQNLLFHTDPSNFEYESIVQVVGEVENIFRSIEDEKIQEEERTKTRDILARIEGLDRVKHLAAPKPSRVLVEERMAPRGLSDASKSSSPPPVKATKAEGGKTSFRRLSDVLQNGGVVGGKDDMWLVVFNDVVLRCQRTGTTSLPLGSAHALRANSPPELQGKSKYATTGRRNPITRPRNLYKFIEIENGNSAQPREGVVSITEEVVRSRAKINSVVQPRIVPMPDDDEDEDSSVDLDDNKSKASKGSSHLSADKLTLQNPIAKRRPGPGGSGTRRKDPIVPSEYSRESSANAKFGSRLVSADSSAARPASRRTQAVTPLGPRPAAPPDEGRSIKVSVTRPAWSGPARTHSTSVQSTKRSRNTSQNNAATRTTTAPPSEVLSSPAPSEDSGVGLYRQTMANDLSLNND